MVETSDVLLILVSILFPPAGVAFLSGCSCDLLINICLTILGYLPGHVHALWLIYKHVQARERFGLQGFTYKGNGRYEATPGAVQNQAPPSYGTIQR
ncbi:UPF0057-domain-containing protein [Tilletiaria anomala UBC 951]|uniref:UPF0057-domain-containing protein n=1 Tax=Tilletiaria anomala (strain ATCC 24038 / CBS 436.72 / UBC 951) TaxID=1037660 RepID=A0A066VL90_TILAU|nr:UPF0057-domain-containing protein [Tilletiaria anomala UBC 951]KDN39534.1 UPF0057-domain-containing protein [Tilletiaria anomala UBC 951]